MTGLKTNERPGTRAQVRYLRMSASKARVVLNLVRDKQVGEAHQILALSERLAAKEIAKVLTSAIANAGHNDDVPAEELFISACYADEGPTLKRFRPRARGRAGAIHKQTCHITVIVSRLSDDALDRLREKAAKSGAGDASADRQARVAKSKGEDVTEVVEETVEEEVVEAEVPEAEVEEVADVTSETQDSDNDGEVNASDASPYGDGSHALINDDPDVMPEGFPIKGNDQSKLYHNENSRFYSRTKAEIWFATDEAAEAAGFSKPPSQIKSESDNPGDDA